MLVVCSISCSHNLELVFQVSAHEIQHVLLTLSLSLSLNILLSFNSLEQMKVTLLQHDVKLLIVDSMAALMSL